MSRCLGGDEEAWTALWARYGPLVKAMAVRAGCTDDEAREVVQSVALVALRRLHTLRDRGKLGGWLATTARLQALTMVRRRRPHDDLDPGLASAEVAADEQLLRMERIELLWQAYGELDQRCQRLLRRLELSDPAEPYEAVAASEGLAVSSIGPIRRRCLLRLKKILTHLSRSPAARHCSSDGDGGSREPRDR